MNKHGLVELEGILSKFKFRYLTICGIGLVSIVSAGYFHLVNDGLSGGVIPTSRAMLSLSEIFLRDVGFAFIIAMGISIGIEAQAREEERSASEAMRKQIALDVFLGVFSRRLPKKYVDRVSETHLFPLVLREELYAELTIAAIPPSVLKIGNLDGQKYVSLSTVYKYYIRNISTSSYTYNLSLTEYVYSEKYTKHFGIVSVRIGDKVFEFLKDIADIESYGSELTYSRDPESGVINLQVPITIDQDGSVYVEMEVRAIKDRNGNEVTWSIMPTTSGMFVLQSTIPGFEVDFSTGTPLSVISRRDDMVIARIDGPLLKNDSVAVWWWPTGVD